MKKSIIMLMAAMLCACNVQVTNPDQPSNGNDTAIPLRLTQEHQQMLVQSNEFSLSMLRQAYETRESENVIISPLSLSMALSMLMNGADTETLEQMKAGLGFKDWTDEEINRYNQLMINTLPRLDTFTKLTLANSLWIRNDFPVKEGFIDSNKLYFMAQVQNVDFHDAATADLINKWAADHTNNLIKQVVDQDLIYDCAMLLANALYFKGIWEDKFDKEMTIKDEKFTTSNNKTEQVDMMVKNAQMKYGIYQKSQLVELDYKGGAYCMDLLLPPAGMDVQTLLKMMQAGDIMKFEENFWPEYEYETTKWRELQDVNLYMPKFTVRYEKKLNDDLKALGMTDMFSGMADFSRLSDIPTYVSFVKQNTYLSVDEEGTEAAAVTVIGTKEYAAMPTEVRLDRPFVLLIREKQYGTILFAAVIGNPNEK